MLKALSYLTILFAFYAFTTTDNEPSNRRVVISGQVNNYTPTKPISLKIYRVSQDYEVITTKLDATGHFFFTFQSPFPLETELIYDTELTVLIQPGDSVYVEFEANKNYLDILTSVKFTGDSEKLNTDISTFKNFWFHNFQTFQIAKTDYSMASMQFNVHDFSLYMDSSQLCYTNCLDAYKAKYNPCEIAITWSKFYLCQQINEALTSYAIMRQADAKTNPNFWRELVDMYKHFQSPWPSDYSFFLNSKNINWYINNYWLFYAFLNEMADATDLSTTKQRTDSLELIKLIEHAPNDIIKQLMLVETFRDEFNSFNLENFEGNQTIIQKHLTNIYLQEIIHKKYTLTKQTLDKPQLSANATLHYSQNITANDLINSIKAENAGKVIYMDCWADYCGPCIAELPNSHQLEQKLSNQEVAFIYVCFNTSETKWKALLDKFQLGGQHYLLDKTQSDEWMKLFNITGIPNYILMDQSGEIVENNSDLRPNLAEERIQQLLH